MLLNLSTLSSVILRNITLMHRYQLRLKFRSAMTAAQLGATDRQDLETDISTAIKRHHEEKIQLIKDSLAKTVRASISDLW